MNSPAQPGIGLQISSLQSAVADARGQMICCAAKERADSYRQPCRSEDPSGPGMAELVPVEYRKGRALFLLEVRDLYVQQAAHEL